MGDSPVGSGWLCERSSPARRATAPRRHCREQANVERSQVAHPYEDSPRLPRLGFTRRFEAKLRYYGASLRDASVGFAGRVACQSQWAAANTATPPTPRFTHRAFPAEPPGSGIVRCEAARLPRRSSTGTQRVRNANVSDAQAGHFCASWTSSQSRHTRATRSCITAVYDSFSGILHSCPSSWRRCSS
jgi:hypothetical protein